MRASPFPTTANVLDGMRRCDAPLLSEAGAGGGGSGGGVCDVCGGPATSRCARCRGVWYCGPTCQRAAWGAHKSACAAAVAAAAAAARGGGEGARGVAVTSDCGDGGGSSGVSASGAADAVGAGDGGTGGLTAATLREVLGAVAMLGSRKAAERAAGVDTLACILSTMGDSNRKLYEFQAAVVEAGGIPLLVRVLDARARRPCALVRRLRSKRARAIQHGYQA
jgi:hypothetical protein